MASVVAVTARSEYVLPARMKISRRSSDSGTTMLPAIFTSETLKTSPSFTLIVMKMSSFSGAIATCVEVTAKFA